MTHWERANDAIQVISSLKRRCIAVGLVTNFDHYPFVRELVDRLGLNSLMNAIVISSEVGSDKPAPWIFECALSMLNTPPESAIHVGDDEVDAGERRRLACGL